MKRKKINTDIGESFLYKNSQPAWWPAIDIHKKIFTCKKNEILFKEGDKVEGVYFMLEGVVKVHKSWESEKELIIRFAKGNDILGHRGLSTYSNIYPITATALSKTTACFIDLAFFRTTMQVNPGFSYAFMMFLADELLLSEQRMRDLAHMPVKARIARVLISLEKKFGTNKEGFITFPVSRQDIASYAGTTYETVYKSILDFSNAGIINTNGKSIAILDTEALASIIS
ncbi:MAG TPA: Crp/Fnr family transcriptional regulator [Puia sp.]|nr:Crp/Fnr family transcriptional regulator [Puia sp.]